MKKEILYITYLLILFIVVLASCQKVDNDRIPPVIILYGSNPQWLTLGCDYNDPGIDVKDDKSDIINVYITDDIDPGKSGEYYVNYTAYDGDSNIAVARRKVVVQAFSIQDYVGEYFVKDTVIPLGPFSTYEASVSIFNIDPPLMKIANFNNFGDNFEAFFTADSTGVITLTYDLNDTLISGTGTTFCDKTGFRLEFLLQIADKNNEYHETTFKLNGKK